MTEAQQKLYIAMKGVLHKVLFSENPYMAGTEITERITRDWEEEAEKHQMSSKDCPFDAHAKLVVRLPCPTITVLIHCPS